MTNNKLSLTGALRTAAAIPAVVLIALALAGCTGGPSESGATSSPAPAASSTEPGPTQTPGSATTPIVMEIDGQTIAGEIDDSATSRSLLAQLPLTLGFDDFGGHEKFAELPEPLDLAGAPAGSDAEPSTIGYYVPDQRLILYYDHVAYYEGIVPIGTYENADAVRNQTTPFDVTIRAAE
jgi:hypothetical protein